MLRIGLFYFLHRSLFLREAAEDEFIAVVAVVQGAIHAADGRGGSTGLFRNVKIGLFAP